LPTAQCRQIASHGTRQQDAEQQADKQKRASDALREAEIKRLELESRAASAAGKEPLSRDLQARADALKLRAELEAQGMTPETAAGVVKAEQGQDQRKRDADAAKEKERRELARQVADLEDEIARRRAAGDEEGEAAAQDRLSALQLARQLEDSLGITREQAEERAKARVANEREGNDMEHSQHGEGGDGFAGRHHGPARLSAADTWGDGRRKDGLRGDGSSSVEALQDRSGTPMRDSFQFPALDAFAANQPVAGSTTQATPQKEGGSESSGNGSNVANAAKQAADAAKQARDATAKTDAALAAEFQTLRSELQQLASQKEEMASQISNNRA
jgi:hypothetical protein